MAEKHPKRPRDLNQWAKRVVDIATMDEDERAALQKKLAAKTKKSAKPYKPGKRSSPS
jgi:1,2-phenylacetyl-CoA epoxidase PaaB subunit